MFQKTPLNTLQWTTSFFYEAQHTLENYKPKAIIRWPTIRKAPYQWSELWSQIHITLSPGSYQELHFKFVHRGLPVNEIVAKWKRVENDVDPLCKSCTNHSLHNVETHLHLFFDCDTAYEIWAAIKPLLQALIPEGKISCWLLTMSIFPKGVSTFRKKLATTLIQISLHEIWCNRNLIENDGQPDISTSIIKIKNFYLRLVQMLCNKMAKGGNLYNFREHYLKNQTLFSLDRSHQLFYM